MRLRLTGAVAAVVLTVLTGCSTGKTDTGRSAGEPSAASLVSSTPPAADIPTAPAPTAPAPSTPAPATPSPTASPTSTPGPPPPTAELPLGGQRILDRFRVVAYYGGPGGPTLGVLGSAPPEQIAAAITARAAQYAAYGLPVQPAMELIATVAQASPGADGRYSKAIPIATVQRYLAVAKQQRMLLILDFQPGRGEFLPQVQQFAAVLADPNVGVALDPEWKVGPGQVPGKVIGSASAASINAVGAYLSHLIAVKHLPDKLLMVHQFTRAMLPDRDAIAHPPGVELVLHADGFGTMSGKLATWQRLAFPGRPDGTGFKLFLRQDTGLMTPAQVMALVPRPDVVTYQ